MTLIEAGPFAGMRGDNRVILADPPWHIKTGKGRHPSLHYNTMPFNEILALPVGDLAHPDGCRLMMWITMPFLHRFPEVLRAWGFRYSTSRVWVKLWPREDEMFIYPSSIARGTGYEVIGNAEMMIIAKRGRPERLGGKKPGSVIFGRRRVHSEKPDLVRDEIASLFAGPRIELFSRSDHPGFASWGLETGKLNAARAA